MHYRVVLSPEAEAQLQALRRHIAKAAGRDVAARYTRAIVDFCRTLSTFPHRGTKRDDVQRGFRTVGFRRRATIVFSVGDDLVTVVGVYYGGQDFEAALRDDEPPAGG